VDFSVWEVPREIALFFSQPWHFPLVSMELFELQLTTEGLFGFQIGMSGRESESDQPPLPPPRACGLTVGGISFDTQNGESGVQFRKTFHPRLIPEPQSFLDLLFSSTRASRISRSSFWQ
jgi:hypothetical protein